MPGADESKLQYENVPNGSLFPKMPTCVPGQSEDLKEILKRLDRIEKGIKELTGLQLINGIWR